MLPKLLIAGFLVAHAAVHTAFLTPAPPATAGGPVWPFDLGRSRLFSPLGVDPGLLRALGTGLVVAVCAGYGAAALGLFGVLPSEAVGVGVAAASMASIALIAAFFNLWFVMGIGIDLVLLWLALSNWSPDALGS